MFFSREHADQASEDSLEAGDRILRFEGRNRRLFPNDERQFGNQAHHQLAIAVEGGGTLTPDNHEKVADGLGRLRELGVDHAIVGVHPAHMANARPIFEAFGEKQLASARG